MKRLLSCAVAVALWLASTLPVSAKETPVLLSDTASLISHVPAGPLVIIGGGRLTENEAVHRAVLDRRSGEGPVCVIPTANNDVPTAMARGVSELDRYGGKGTAIALDLGVHNPHRVFDPDVVATLRDCSGFYFEGGRPVRILEVFRPGGVNTPAYEAIMGRWRDGAVVAGTSAGAAMMSEVMLQGGSSATALQKEKVIGEPESDAGVVLNPFGMGFLQGAVIDQHFLARGRIGRLIVTVLNSAAVPVGFGIDEQTALVIDSTRASVVGVSGVVLLDARGAERETEGRGGYGIRMQLLGSGDQLDLTTGAISRGCGKHALSRDLGSVTVLQEIFGPLAFLPLVTSMARTPTDSITVPAGDRYWIRLTKENGFEAVATPFLTSYVPFDANAPAQLTEMPAGFSAGPFIVDLIQMTR